jgi:hypothetical protein
MKMSRKHLDVVQQRRSSNASGPHQDKRQRRARTRSATLKRELERQ